VQKNNPMKNDFDWPGAYPMQSEHNAMTVNVRHDDFPQHVRSLSVFVVPMPPNCMRRLPTLSLTMSMLRVALP
jgi:hypothetical protein